MNETRFDAIDQSLFYGCTALYRNAERVLCLQPRNLRREKAGVLPTTSHSITQDVECNIITSDYDPLAIVMKKMIARTLFQVKARISRLSQYNWRVIFLCHVNTKAPTRRCTKFLYVYCKVFLLS